MFHQLCDERHPCTLLTWTHGLKSIPTTRAPCSTPTWAIKAARIWPNVRVCVWVRKWDERGCRVILIRTNIDWTSVCHVNTETHKGNEDEEKNRFKAVHVFTVWIKEFLDFSRVTLSCTCNSRKQWQQV